MFITPFTSLGIAMDVVIHLSDFFLFYYPTLFTFVIFDVVMNSVNMSQALGSSTQNPINIKSNNLLGSVNQLSLQIPNPSSRHENIHLKITMHRLVDAYSVG